MPDTRFSPVRGGAWRRRLGVLLARAVLLVPGAAGAAGELGTVSRDDQLRERPYPLAPVVAAVGAGTRVAVLDRQGYWLRVKRRDGAAEGWIHLIRIRYAHDGGGAVAPAGSGGAAGQSGSDGGAGGGAGGGLFSSLARGATGLLGGSARSTPRETTTIGIRGLSAEDLRTASPNRGALQALKRHQADARAARVFAAAGGLRTQDVQDPG